MWCLDKYRPPWNSCIVFGLEECLASGYQSVFSPSRGVINVFGILTMEIIFPILEKRSCNKTLALRNRPGELLSRSLVKMIHKNFKVPQSMYVCVTIPGYFSSKGQRAERWRLKSYWQKEAKRFRHFIFQFALHLLLLVGHGCGVTVKKIKRMLKPSYPAARPHLPVSCNKRPALVQWVVGGGSEVVEEEMGEGGAGEGKRGGDGRTECAAGRCAAAAPISGQTPLVCFLQENMACYTSAHTVPVSELSYTTSQKWQAVLSFFPPLLFSCHFWRTFEWETLFTPISSMSWALTKSSPSPAGFCFCVCSSLLCIAWRLISHSPSLCKSFHICLDFGAGHILILLFCCMDECACFTSSFFQVPHQFSCSWPAEVIKQRKLAISPSQ